MKKAYLFFIIALVLFSKVVYADQMSFGSIGHNQRVTMIPGEIREFKLSFFNYRNTPLVVKIEKTGSNEIRTFINPRYFVLENQMDVINPMGEEEWVVLGNNYAKTVPVYVTLKIPDNISDISRNYHIVKIVATATTEGGGSSGIREKMKAAREFSYAITVPGNINARTWEEYEETLEQFYQELQSNKSESDSGFWNIGVKDSEKETQEEERGQLPTGFFSLGGDKEDSVSFLYIIAAIAMIILVYFVYRRLRR